MVKSNQPVLVIDFIYLNHNWHFVSINHNWLVVLKICIYKTNIWLLMPLSLFVSRHFLLLEGVPAG
jgi:hypothetical protein